jgi:Flp pilus assembly protein TadD
VLEKKDAPAAIRVFMLNAQAFPNSANVWDSLADAYMRAGDMKAAKRNYEKSLKLDPRNESARANLKKINAATGK